MATKEQEQQKDQRLVFAAGYERAWSHGAPASSDPEYLSGYEEGRKDRDLRDKR